MEKEGDCYAGIVCCGYFHNCVSSGYYNNYDNNVIVTLKKAIYMLKRLKV